MIAMPPREERGLTLTELTIVMVLASLVMLGMVGFYMNSQATWMDASAQAITQREATNLVEDIAGDVHVAAHAYIETGAGPDSLNTLYLYRAQVSPPYYETNPYHVFWWDPADHRIHEGPDRTTDEGPIVTSEVERFDCELLPPPEPGQPNAIVRIDVTLRSSQGQTVHVARSMSMINRRIS